MEDNTKADAVGNAATKSRRKFLKSAAGVAVTAPAAVVLLNAATIKSAAAQPYIGLPCDQGFDQTDLANCNGD